MRVPFNKPHVNGSELTYIQQAIDSSHLSGNGQFTKMCQAALVEQTSSKAALLVHSGTAALELAALLLDVVPGDEIIMPSFTFVSTANAFVLRGAVPVFVDIRRDTLNLDESLVDAAITSKTKAICPVHYGGVSCAMDSLQKIAITNNLRLVEDAAQGLGSVYKEQPLGSLGALAALSFHDTKNITCGEGGALLINDEALVERAEIIADKGTDRQRFFKGLVDKYQWFDIGSSFFPSEIEAAFLWSQLEMAKEIKLKRLKIWNSYNALLGDLESRGKIRRPIIPKDCGPNGHLYFILTNTPEQRDKLLKHLRSNGIDAIFHYIPLHSSPAGLRYGRKHGSLHETENLSSCLIRLPLWTTMAEIDVLEVVRAIYDFFHLEREFEDIHKKHLACS